MRHAVLLAIAALVLTVPGSHAQTTSETPSECLKAVREAAAQRQKAAGRMTAELIKELNEKRAAAARECAARFTAASVPAAELASLADLYGEGQERDLARQTIEKALAESALDEPD